MKEQRIKVYPGNATTFYSNKQGQGYSSTNNNGKDNNKGFQSILDKEMEILANIKR